MGNGKLWTAKDINLMTLLARSGTPEEDVAARLGRSVDAVRAKAKREDITLTSGATPAPTNPRPKRSARRRS